MPEKYPLAWLAELVERREEALGFLGLRLQVMELMVEAVTTQSLLSTFTVISEALLEKPVPLILIVWPANPPLLGVRL